MLLEVCDIVGHGLYPADVYFECREAAEDGCVLGLAEVVEGIVLKHSVSYRDCTHTGGQRTSGHESDVIGSNSYVIQEFTKTKL